MDNVYIMDHPLIQHKLSILRDKNTGTNEFRKLTEEIAVLMGYEALRDLPLEDVEVETPIEKCKTPMIAGKKLAVVPILRAGLGMTNGILVLVPSAKVGHIGLYRDPKTHEPVEYYCKLPSPIELRTIVVTDPMLATGGSAVDAIKLIKEHGGKKIKFMCSSGRRRASAQRASGRSDLCGPRGPLPQRECLYLPGSRRCRRPHLRNEVIFLFQ